jgi:hypothetical protein
MCWLWWVIKVGEGLPPAGRHTHSNRPTPLRGSAATSHQWGTPDSLTTALFSPFVRHLPLGMLSNCLQWQCSCQFCVTHHIMWATHALAPCSPRPRNLRLQLAARRRLQLMVTRCGTVAAVVSATTSGVSSVGAARGPAHTPTLQTNSHRHAR